MIQIYLTKAQWAEQEPHQELEETPVNIQQARRLAIVSAQATGFGCVCGAGGIIMMRQYEQHESE